VYAFLYLASNITTENANQYPRIIDKSDGGSAANGWCFYPDGGNNNLYFSAGGANNASTTPLNRGIVTGLSFSLNTANTILEMYQDGAQIRGLSSPVSSLPTTTTNAAIGNWNHASDRQYRTPIYAIYVWDRFLEQSEHVNVNLDPYQFLIPA
jgi:hypothetical protein